MGSRRRRAFHAQSPHPRVSRARTSTPPRMCTRRAEVRSVEVFSSSSHRRNAVTSALALIAKIARPGTQNATRARAPPRRRRRRRRRSSLRRSSSRLAQRSGLRPRGRRGWAVVRDPVKQFTARGLRRGEDANHRKPLSGAVGVGSRALAFGGQRAARERSFVPSPPRFARLGAMTPRCTLRPCLVLEYRGFSLPTRTSCNGRDADLSSRRAHGVRSVATSVRERHLPPPRL
jgi:hypothetical protein